MGSPEIFPPGTFPSLAGCQTDGNRTEQAKRNEEQIVLNHLGPCLDLRDDSRSGADSNLNAGIVRTIVNLAGPGDQRLVRGDPQVTVLTRNRPARVQQVSNNAVTLRHSVPGDAEGEGNPNLCPVVVVKGNRHVRSCATYGVEPNVGTEGSRRPRSCPCR